MAQYFSSMHKALGLILKIVPKKELSQQRKKIQIERDGLEKGPKLHPLCPIKPTVLYNPLEGFNNHKRRILWHVKFKFEMPKGLFKEHNPILHLHVADGCSQCYNMKLNIF